MDGLPDAPQKFHVKMDIMQGVQSGCKDFIRKIKVPQISPRIMLAGIAGTMLIDRSPVLSILCLLDRDLSCGGEKHSIPSIPGGKDAVEEVNAKHHAIQNILGGSHSH